MNLNFTEYENDMIKLAAMYFLIGMLDSSENYFEEKATAILDFVRFCERKELRLFDTEN